MTDRFTLPLVALFLSACGAAGGGPKTTLTVNWTYKNADGTAATCPANYNKVKILAQGRTAYNDITTGDPFSSAIFDCAAGTGTIDLLTSGDEPNPCDANGNCTRSQATGLSPKYDVVVVATEATGNATYIVSRNQRVDLSSGPKSLDFVFYPTAGFVIVEWSLTAKSTGDTLGCAPAAVDSVKLTSTLVYKPDGTPVTGGKVTTDTFTCAGDATVGLSGTYSVGGGFSSPLEAGQYTMEIEAFTGGTSVGKSSPSNQEINDRGRIYAVNQTFGIEISTR